MRKTKEICRLANTASLSKRAIAHAVGVSNSTVSDVLLRFAASGLSWPAAEAMSETELERRLYREQGNTAPDPALPAHLAIDYTPLSMAISECTRGGHLKMYHPQR